MKTQPTAFLLGALLFASAGCKNFLDQPVLGQYAAGQFFTSDANAVLAVNAAYVPLSFRDGGSNTIWVLGDVASDDAVKGSNPGDQADFENVDLFNITPTNAAVEAQWRRDYDGVFKCNVVLDGLPADNTSVSATVRQQAVGQAQFLRAYYYFQLTALYGDIPLHLKVETPEELQSPALPQAQIYAQVEADCQAAAAALPDAWTGTDAGRATKGAALALLAKTYLYEKKWPLAAQTAQAVGALGKYTLLPVFADNFRAATKDNSEVVFAVRHTSGLSPGQGITSTSGLPRARRTATGSLPPPRAWYPASSGRRTASLTRAWTTRWAGRGNPFLACPSTLPGPARATCRRSTCSR